MRSQPSWPPSPTSHPAEERRSHGPQLPGKRAAHRVQHRHRRGNRVQSGTGGGTAQSREVDMDSADAGRLVPRAFLSYRWWPTGARSCCAGSTATAVRRAAADAGTGLCGGGAGQRLLRRPHCNQAIVRWALQAWLGVTDQDPQPLPDDQARERELVGSYRSEVMTLTISTDRHGLTLAGGIKPEIRAAADPGAASGLPAGRSGPAGR